MLEWVNGLLGKTAGVPEGVPEAWVTRLQARLKPLDDAMQRDVLAYVLHGEPLAVLGKLAASEKFSDALGVTSGSSTVTVTAPQLYEHFTQVPPAVALRWARVLEAAATHVVRLTQLIFERGVHWPEVLLVHCSGVELNIWSSNQRNEAPELAAAHFDALCVEDGLSPAAWLLGGFQIPGGTFYYEHRPRMLTTVGGYAEALQRHAEALAPVLLPAPVNAKLHVLKMLEPATTDTLEQWAPQLAELLASGSKQVRAATQSLLPRVGPQVVEALRQLALTAKPESRLLALRVLATLARPREDAALTQFTRDTAVADKAAAVQALIGEWDLQDAAPTEVSYDYEVPVIDWSPAANAVAPEVLARLWAEANATIEKANAQAREHHARSLANGHQWTLRQDDPFLDTDAQALQQKLDLDGPATRAQLSGTNTRSLNYLGSLLIKLAEGGHFTPVAMVKTLGALGFITASGRHADAILTACANALHRATGRPTLLEWSELLGAHGYEPERLLNEYCRAWGGGLAAGWPDADVWPFVAHHQDLFVRLLQDPPVNDWHFSRAALFTAVTTLPAPLPAVVNSLFELALGSAKGDRALAQEALKTQPDKEARIIAALESGKAEVRTVAAQWLGRLRHAPALPALEQAVRKEKHDIAKGALLDALQALGQPVEAYLDRDALGKDAAKLLAKGLPKDLEWFPWAALPAVHWADTGAAITPEVLQWLLAQACKQKSPEPNAVLRKLCGLMVPREREALGQFVLETWLVEDVRPGTQEQAFKLAQNEAQSTWNSMQSYPQYYKDSPLFSMSVAELTAHYLPGYLRQPIGSAIGSKGLLAVAAACCVERAAPPVQRYLKEWYGTRAAHGKALIAMLAWIEHPSATQLMLSIGSRFRTKSFQEEATKQAEALAERKGWTLAELADRTMPSAGFDETGTLALSYGPRSFTARLLPDFKVALTNPDGKTISALPEPRQDDDEAQAKDAKKALSAAKKELKSIVDLQTDRLYEALCTARDWPAADWTDYLLQHPVVRHLVQRLVWIETLEDGSSRTFRPLDDGSLTDVNDDPVELTAGSHVRLAHDSLLEASEATAWQQHLADYAIKPLFQQFGKGSYALPADKANTTEVLDFQGHLIETFALRGRATKLGYSRGGTEDGGWFYAYEKRFPTLGLLAVIEFTGNGLPEENRTAALRKLSFSSTGDGERWSRSSLPLSQVPKVLLSECYDDLRLIAAEGSGFDPEWEKKSEY